MADRGDAEGAADPAFLICSREGRRPISIVGYPAQCGRPRQARLHLQVLRCMHLQILESCIVILEMHLQICADTAIECDDEFVRLQ